MLIKNVGTNPISAWGVCFQGVPATGTFDNGRRWIGVRVPQMPLTYTGSAWVYINDSVALGEGESGQGRMAAESPRGWVRYNTGDGTPSRGEMWGPTNGSALLSKNGAGFEIIGDAKNGRVLCNYVHAPKLYVQLNAALAPADPDLETGQKTAEAHVLVPAGSGNNLSDNTSWTITVTNRWLSVDLTAGKKLWVVWSWLYLEWVPVAAECPD